MSSLKQHWQLEIERFSDEKACVITGSARNRTEQYRTDASLFKITSYEAVLRDVTIISRLKPDLTILDELVKQNGRKLVIFSEWTTMTMLIGKYLSREGIPFVELSGKVPVVKRQALIDEFDTNPACMVFLSTDSGGTGLNLQSADCVVNFEMPWNPARVNQRIGRIHRIIGQKSKCINVINLIAKFSIEERIMAGSLVSQRAAKRW